MNDRCSQPDFTLTTCWAWQGQGHPGLCPAQGPICFFPAPKSPIFPTSSPSLGSLLPLLLPTLSEPLCPHWEGLATSPAWTVQPRPSQVAWWLLVACPVQGGFHPGCLRGLRKVWGRLYPRAAWQALERH